MEKNKGYIKINHVSLNSQNHPNSEKKKPETKSQTKNNSNQKGYLVF